MKETTETVTATTPEDDGGVVFKNRMQAFRELKRLGYKIEKSKFYGHCSKPGESNGICRVEKNGTVTETSLRRYVKHPGSQLESTGDGEGAVVAEEQRAKLRMENERLEMQNQKLRMEIATMEGRYIERDQVYLELAARAAVFENGLRHWWNMNAAKLVELAVGDPENARDLILNAGLRGMDSQVNEYARADTFKVIFRKADYYESAEKEKPGATA